MSKEEAKLGLKRLRHAAGKKPTYTCENCHCMRYTPCGCKHKS